MEPVLRPPVAPMLAKLASTLPEDEHSYEPKWDGFRCLVFRTGDEVDLRSRHGKPLARYFPEVVAAVRQLPETNLVLDAEIVVTTEYGIDFDALLKRIHPAPSHVERMVQRAPASLVAFDVLAVGDEDLLSVGFAQRRARLEAVLAEARPPVHLTPLTTDVSVARGWLAALPRGIDGVVAKHAELPYRPGKRVMVKVKPRRTADCVVAGARLAADRPAVTSLLLGLYDDAGELRHVGVATAFTEARRAELVEELRPYVVELGDHPWAQGYALEGGSMGRLGGAAGRWQPGMELDWVPLRPCLVCEVAYDQVDRGRWRHAGRFLRWRPDRDATSCTLDQLDDPASPDVSLLP